jgi:hypothetical protein
MGVVGSGTQTMNREGPMRSHVVWAVMTVAMVSACAPRMTRESGGDVAVDTRSAAGGARDGQLRGMNGWERVRGSAFALPRDNGTRVAVTVERGFTGSNYAWDVREGTCAAPGQVVGDIASYPTLFIGADERDSKVADVAVPLERGKAYIVSIYAVPADRAPTIACGALNLTLGTGN